MNATSEPRQPLPPDPPSAGEDVCWLGMLCPQCGAMPEGEGALDPSVPCWRCGAVRVEEEAAPDAGAGPGPE